MKPFLRQNALQVLTLLLVVLQLWLNEKYVTREEYRRDQQAAAAAMESLRSSMTALATSLAILDSEKKTWADHELRLRSLERGKRLSNHE